MSLPTKPKEKMTIKDISDIITHTEGTDEVCVWLESGAVTFRAPEDCEWAEAREFAVISGNDSEEARTALDEWLARS